MSGSIGKGWDYGFFLTMAANGSNSTVMALNQPKLQLGLINCWPLWWHLAVDAPLYRTGVHSIITAQQSVPANR